MTVNDRTSPNVCQTTSVMADFAVSFSRAGMHKALFVKRFER